MGTRHLLCVLKKQEYKLAQYGQNDGSPEWCGADILRFLKSGRMDDFLRNLPKCTWAECGDAEENEYAVDILERIADAENGLMLYNFHEFAEASIPCEWCYVINLDDNLLEVYRGMNTNPLDPEDRFFLDYSEDVYEETYYPVRHLISFDLWDLPEEEEFIESCMKVYEE